MARPSEYKDDYNEQAYKLCLLGATDKDIADFFDVTETTINNWKKDFPLFFESIVNGKKKADMEVAHSLYKSANDRIVIDYVPIKKKKVYWLDGKRHEEEEVEVFEIEKLIPSDFRSQMFWLRNRAKAQWKDKPEEADDDYENKANNVNVTIQIKDYSKDSE